MNTKKAVLAAIYCQTAFNLLSGGLIMSTDEKKLDSQQVAPPLPDNIGITQSSGLDHHAVFNRQLIRRLTPLECERLQGFPDGWTEIPGASDSARYKALGNSVAIPCVTFVLRGIAAVLRAAGSG